MILKKTQFFLVQAILVILVSRIFENHITEPPGHQDAAAASCFQATKKPALLPWSVATISSIAGK